MLLGITKMTISIHLDEEQSRQLVEFAQRLQIDATELAKAAIRDLVGQQADDFDQAARKVLEKNRELYRRLS